MCTSARMPFTVLLRDFPIHYLPQPRHPLFDGQVLVGGCENATARVLLGHALLDQFVHLPVLFGKLIAMDLYVLQYDIELLACQGRQNLKDLILAVAAMKPVKNVCDGDAGRRELRTAASVNDFDGCSFHHISQLVAHGVSSVGSSSDSYASTSRSLTPLTLKYTK